MSDDLEEREIDYSAIPNEQCDHPCEDYFLLGSCKCTDYKCVFDDEDDAGYDGYFDDEGDEDGTLYCQQCGILIDYDVTVGDDVVRPAYVSESGDLYCNVCGPNMEYEQETVDFDEYGDEEPWLDPAQFDDLDE